MGVVPKKTPGEFRTTHHLSYPEGSSVKDFLFLAHFRTKCERDVQALVNLCFKLGVPLVPGKAVAPTRDITFLDIILDTVLMEARLLEEFQRKQKVTLRDRQSLIGILNFACTFIVPGRAFLRRIIYITRVV